MPSVTQGITTRTPTMARLGGISKPPRKKLKTAIVSGAGQADPAVSMEIATLSTTSGRKVTPKLRQPYRRYYDKFSIGSNKSVHPVYPVPETKWLDFPVGSLGTPTSITSTGSLFNINSIPNLVSNVNGRMGSQVSLSSLFYQFVCNTGSAGNAAIVRHMILYDRQANFALPPASAILADLTTAVTSPMNTDFHERFVIIASDRVQLSPEGDNIAFVKGYRKVNQVAQYSPTPGIPNTGALVLFLISNQPAGTTAPTVYGIWRTRFQDN